MRLGLIGYTGFVGSNLARARRYTDLYNSSNVQTLKGQVFDRLVCCGISAVKWLANRDPNEDWVKIQKLIEVLKSVKAKSVWVVSTVDVYGNPTGVNELSPIDESVAMPYGRHRWWFEEFIRQHFKKTTTVRLPGLFGPGLKKNIIYDFLHENNLQSIHRDEQHQFYDLGILDHHFQVLEEKGIAIANLSSEPLTVREIAQYAFDRDFLETPDKALPCYDMRTLYAADLGGSGQYLYSRQTILERMRAFVTKASL